MSFNLYSIDSAILSVIDEETGEIIDENALAVLEQNRLMAIEEILLYYKNHTSNYEALKAESERIKERMDQEKKRAESAKNFMEKYLAGEKFESPRVKATFRKSESVDVFDKGQIPDKYLRMTVSYDPNKTEIKKAIKEGQEVPGAKLVQKNNITIK